MIPSFLTLFGCRWAVLLKDGRISDHNQYGCTSFERNEICIDRRLALDVQWTVLVHEVLHVVSHCLALELTEEIVCRLDAGLGEFVLQILPPEAL